MGDAALPAPEDEVAIIPNYSPSAHLVDEFDTDHENVKVVTMREAVSTGFDPCHRCFDLDPEDLVPLSEREDRPKDQEERGQGEGQ